MAQTFWDHLDELRNVLLRCVVVWGVCTIAMFCLRTPLFSFLFAPTRADFITYRLIDYLLAFFHLSDLTGGGGWEQVGFINTQLTAQFMTHIQVAAIAGLVISFPYLIWQFYGFIAPALYRHEKSVARRIIGFGSVLFFLGLSLNYLIIFPFAFRFLSTYQVQADVVNMISLSSYMSSLLILSLIMGVMFEMPIVIWTLGKAGFIHADLLRRYRRHAFVILMILAAIITPTGDAFTLLLVTLPLYLLYEISIFSIRNI